MKNKNLDLLTELTPSRAATGNKSKFNNLEKSDKRAELLRKKTTREQKDGEAILNEELKTADNDTYSNTLAPSNQPPSIDIPQESNTRTFSGTSANSEPSAITSLENSADSLPLSPALNQATTTKEQADEETSIEPTSLGQTKKEGDSEDNDQHENQNRRLIAISKGILLDEDTGRAKKKRGENQKKEALGQVAYEHLVVSKPMHLDTKICATIAQMSLREYTEEALIYYKKHVFTKKYLDA